MRGHLGQTVRLCSAAVAIVGGTLLLSQVAAGLIVVHVLGSVVRQVLG